MVSLVSILPVIDPPMADEPLAMTAMTWAITLAMTAIDLWLLGCIWRRRNWARWVMLALLALGLAATVTLSRIWCERPSSPRFPWPPLC